MTELLLERNSDMDRERIDHSRAPILDGITDYLHRGIVPFSTPGHKLGVGADAELREVLGEAVLRADIPLGGGVGDTHFSGEALRAAEALAADAWNADRSFFLLNGSSAGNHAFLLAAVGPGDKVIVSRDLHKSLLVALILTGAEPVYLSPRLHPELNVGLGITADQVAAALDRHPDAKLVALVSPSYCGVPSDLAAIAAIAHARGVTVHVDEAWGPHFPFHPALPPSAMTSGVDGAVTSMHKVLGSLTQAAILNVRAGLVDPDRVRTTVGMAQTTSPSALILASIDAARRQMALHGRDLLDRTVALAADARRRLQAIPGIAVLDAEELGIAEFDLTKLVVDVDALGITGYEAEQALRYRFGVGPEMSDLVGLVFLITIGDTPESVDRLVDAFATLSREHSRGGGRRAELRSSGTVIAPGRQAMTPREAFFAQAKATPLAAANGEVSAELVIPYPPGIPVLAPGEIITDDKIAYLREGAAHGMYLSGPADPTLATIRVVA
ncbi:MAG: aminotransferase class V-fold PLP-dependent enzyme [Thermomicrobiales bacterium]|nr:aminotransferase class V-fold PLP-dependent enzyme [Thermomicrobiales bacterium]